MAQEINEAGTIEIATNKNVIFTSRSIKEIHLIEGESVIVVFLKNSKDGSVTVTTRIPYESFNKNAEQSIWETVDKFGEGV